MAGSLQGKVVSIGPEGNLVTDISADRLRAVPTDDRTTVTCQGHVTSGIFPADHRQPEMTFLALVPPQGCLELTIVGERAGDFLGIRPGAPVTVRW